MGTRFFESVHTCINWVIDTVDNFIQSFSDQRKIEHDADFGKTADILNRFNKGWAFGNNLRLDLSNSLKGCLVYGSSGAGKGALVAVNNILHMMGVHCLTIVDPSGQLLSLVSGAAKERGIPIDVINPNDPCSGYNPLHFANTISEIKRVAKLLIINSIGSNAADNFWNISSENLLVILIRLVKTLEPQYRNLFTVSRLLSLMLSRPQSLDKLIIRSGDITLIEDYKQFIGFEPKMKSSIIATCTAALSIYKDPNVALTTSFNSIELTDRSAPRILFYVCTVPSMKYLSSLTSLFAEQVLASAMQEIPPDDALCSFLIIDEASSCGAMPSLPIAFSNLRKYRSSIMCLYQSPFQVQQAFSISGAKTLEDNAFSIVHLPKIDISVASQLSQRIGKFEYEDNGKKMRNLMEASEIVECKEHFICLGNNRIIKTTLKPYYDSPKFNRLSKLPPYIPKHVIPFTEPPMLQID